MSPIHIATGDLALQDPETLNISPKSRETRPCLLSFSLLRRAHRVQLCCLVGAEDGGFAKAQSIQRDTNTS